MSEHERARYAWRDLATVPSALSLLRVPLAAVFVFVVDRPWIALAVLAAAGLTDVLDGWYARRYAQCTPTGALVDGATDKLLVATVAATLLHARALTVGEVLMLGARDLGEVLTTAWIALRRDDHALHEEQRANALGKVTTLAQFAAISLAILRWPHREMCVVTAVSGALAALSYARRAR
jgi:cardiolipin synthase